MENIMRNNLSTDWKNVKDLVIYGFGKVAHDNIKFFKTHFNILYIVDSDIGKCNCEYQGIKVKHIDEVIEELGNKKTVIMTANRNALSIGEALEKHGLKEGINYCSMEQFLTEWFWTYEKKVCLMEVHTTITTRCTLNCKHCNMFMPYYKRHIDYTADEIMNDLDLLFKHVDYIVAYRLLGGEPLISKELPKLIRFIGNMYGDRIGSIGVITNGTIAPSEELIAVSKRYDVQYDFSDYTDAVDYRDKFNNSVNIVKNAGLRYRVNNSMRWCDFGFPTCNRMYSFENVREHMLSCGPLFHGLNDGKFYYCHVSWSADKAGLLRNASDDYIELQNLEVSDDSKKMILQHSNGEIAKGFVKLCKICGGCGNDNTEYVKAAVQMDRNQKMES